MIHLDFQEFKDVLNTLKGGSWNGGTPKRHSVPDFLIGQWYAQYLKYENDWDYYFHNIFLPNFPKDGNCEINIILFESGPGGFSFPHPNYMFLSEMLDQEIHNQIMDKYINRVLDMAGITPIPLTRRDKLSKLAEQRYLIIDLLPTHGITLKDRSKIWKNGIVRTKALEKITNSIELTSDKVDCENLEPVYYSSAEVKNIHEKKDKDEQLVINIDDLSKIINDSNKL